MNRPMAWVVACFTGNSGLTDYSVSLARGLSELSSGVLFSGVNTPAAFARLGVEIRPFFRRSRWYPIDIVRFCIHILSIRPRVLVFQAQLKAPLLEGLLALLFRFSGVRCVVTVHDVLPHYPRPWSRLEFGWFYRRFDRVVVHSEASRSAVKQMGVRAPVLVVPHGVYDIFRQRSPAKADARSRIGLHGSNEFCVLFFGHLETRKGLLPFLQAAIKAGQHSGIRFILAGSNDLSRSSEASTVLESARLLPHVTVHDKRVPFEAVEDYFCSADAVALPYLEGTTSGVLKLALAFGVPAIATRVGDFPEQLPPGAGVLLDADEQLADRLIWALEQVRANHQDYSGAMSAAAAKCNWGDIAAAYHRFMFEGLGEYA